jgi:hypothetical protein
MNCQTFSTGLSSGDFGDRAMMVTLGRNDEARRHVPAGLIDQEHGVRAGRNGLSDLDEMQVHRLGIAGGQDQGCTFALFWSDGAEDVGRGGR